VFLDFVLFVFVSTVLAMILAGKSISGMTCFVLNGINTLTQSVS